MPYPTWEKAPNLYVGQTADLPPQLRGALHRHNYYEVMWLAKGVATFFHDFRRYPLHAGALAFIGPGQVHTWEGDWNHFELLVVGFQASTFAYPEGDPRFLAHLPFFDNAAQPYLQLDNGAGTHMDHLFRTLLRHFLAHGKEQEPLLRAYLTVLLAEAQDRYVRTPVEPIDNAATQLCKAFRLAVDRHYIERKQVQGYADLLGVTTNHLVKTVRETTGVTPGQLIQDRLLLEAKRLLAHSPASISHISQQLAFAAPSQFGRWFKHAVDLSPGQFRKGFANQKILK